MGWPKSDLKTAVPEAGWSTSMRADEVIVMLSWSGWRHFERPANASIQNNSDLAQGLFQFAPLKSGMTTSIWRQEGTHGTKTRTS